MTADSSRPAGRVATIAEVERIADQVARAVSGCPGVARLAAGPVGTYLPHRVVPGVAVRDRSVRVVVVARYGHRLDELAGRVRAAARDAAGGRRVDVVIEDIEVPVDSRAGAAPRG